jgi:hypothetical protein
VLFVRYDKGDEMKKDEMDRAWKRYGSEEKYIQVGRGNLKRRDP